MKKIGLIGTFIRDHIVPLHGDTVDSIGGIYHSLAYAAFLGAGAFTLVPVARLGRDFSEKVLATLADFPGVDLSQIILVECSNTQVDLIYNTPTSRDEMTSPPMAPLQPAEVQGLTDADAILINLITGEDVALDTLTFLKEATAATLFLDFHTLALGIDATGKRYYRKPEKWQRWLELPHFVQMNEYEACTLGDIADKNDTAALFTFLKRTLARGPRGMHITLGEKGVLSGLRTATGQIETRHICCEFPGLEVQDIIGCGDAFGSAFMISFLRSNDFFAAASFANKIATLNTTFMGSLTKENFSRKIKPHATFEE